MNMQKNYSRTLALALLLLTFITTGCASKYGTQTTAVSYYPICYKPIADLRAEEAATGNATATGAIAGALLGALIGGLATGDAGGALVGAAAGGTIGAVGGHAYGKSQEAERDAEFFRQYAGQLTAETAEMDRASAAAKIAAKCYDDNFKQIIAMTHAGNMSKIELTNRYEEIRDGLTETSRILQTTYANMADKEQTYTKIMAEETGVSDPVYAKKTTKKNIAQKKPARTTQTAKAEVTTAAQSTEDWQASRENLEVTRREIDEQLAANLQTLEALEG